MPAQTAPAARKSDRRLTVGKSTVVLTPVYCDGESMARDTVRGYATHYLVREQTRTGAVGEMLGLCELRDSRGMFTAWPEGRSHGTPYSSETAAVSHLLRR